MIDAVTLEFPHVPPGGWTKEYMQSRDFILERMAAKLDRLYHGSGPPTHFISGEPGAGKTTMLAQLQDVASRRHGGIPTVALQIKAGKSVFRMFAEALLTQLDQPMHAQRDLKMVKDDIKEIGRLARLDVELYHKAFPTMKERLLALCQSWKEADLRVAVFIDDVHETADLELRYLVHFISTTQFKGVPMFFVVSGPKSIVSPIRAVRSDATRSFDIHKITRDWGI